MDDRSLIPDLLIHRLKLEHSKTPAIFWLDEERAHDQELLKKVRKYLGIYNKNQIDISIKDYNQAIRKTLERQIRGLDTISVTGNVLRDYLTDLFPIMELGTSAKMLSIVPLIAGGGLYETGAGGSAPKHVEQLETENHLRWDSLGEFLALTVSLEELGIKFSNQEAIVLSKTLDQAITKLLEENKSPSRKTGELDNRGSHFYLALYWSEALSNQKANTDLKDKFNLLHIELTKNEDQIIKDLTDIQGKKSNLKGYYYTDKKTTEKIMRPSKTFNKIIENF